MCLANTATAIMSVIWEDLRKLWSVTVAEWGREEMTSLFNGIRKFQVTKIINKVTISAYF